MTVAATASLLALVDADRRIERTTRPPGDHLSALLDDPPSPLARVLAGEAAHGSLLTPGAHITAQRVRTSAGATATLIQIVAAGEDAAGGPVLADQLDHSPVAAYLKTLDGRYERVNAAHEALIGSDAAQLVGHIDAELPAEATIDGPRLGARDAGAEDGELEYVVPTTGSRPSLLAIRFFLRDPDGEPTGVCGVAAPFAEAWRVRDEAERLRDADRVTRLAPADARAHIIGAWDLTPTFAEETVDDNAPAAPIEGAGRSAPAGASEDERGAEVEEARLRTEQSRVEAEQARAEVVHLRLELDTANRELEEARAAAAREKDAAEESRTTAQAARAEAAQALLSIERLEAASATMTSRLEQAEDDARVARRRADDAEAADRAARLELEQTDVVTRGLRVQLDELEAAAARARASAEAAESDARDSRARAEAASAAAAERVGTIPEAPSVDEHVLGEMRDRLGRIEAERDALLTEAAELRAQGSSAEQSIAESRRERADAEERVARALAEAASLRASHAAAVERHATELESVRQQAAGGMASELAAARAADGERLEAALRRVEAAAVPRHAGEDQHALVAELRARLEAAEARAASLTTEAASLRARLEAEQTNLEHSRAERTALEERLERRHASELESARERAASELSRQLTAVRDQAAVELDAARAAAAAELAAAREGDRERLEAALRRLEATVDVPRDVGEDQRPLVAELRSRLEIEEARAGSLRAEAATAHRDLAAEQARLEETRRERAALEARLADTGAQLLAGREEISALRAEVASERAAHAAALAAAMTERDAALAEAAVNAEPAPAPTRPVLAESRGSQSTPRAPGLRWDAGAQRALARVFGDHDDLREGMHRAVTVVGAEGGWDLVAAWLPDPRGRLRAGATWSEASLAELAETGGRVAHASDSTVLGAALYASAPLWRDVRDSGDDERLRAASAHGASTALVIPIRAGVARLGVLECLAIGEIADMAGLGLALEAVGLQFGQFVARSRARRSPAVR